MPRPSNRRRHGRDLAPHVTGGCIRFPRANHAVAAGLHRTPATVGTNAPTTQPRPPTAPLQRSRSVHAVPTEARNVTRRLDPHVKVANDAAPCRERCNSGVGVSHVSHPAHSRGVVPSTDHPKIHLALSATQQRAEIHAQSVVAEVRGDRTPPCMPRRSITMLPVYTGFYFPDEELPPPVRRATTAWSLACAVTQAYWWLVAGAHAWTSGWVR